MIVNKSIFATLLFLVGFTYTHAQTEIEEKLEKFKSEKVAFISNELRLTTKEAQSFWPIYNEFDDKRQAINIERLKVTKEQQKTALTEKEASDLVDKIISLQKKEALLSEEYSKKFQTVIPATKVLKLYAAEIKFKRYLLKKLKEGNKLSNTKRFE